tara:strand:+ start:13874 stop:14494 length:621 start_codon:yes stop_codon:yes gene_type:complete
MKTYGAKSLIRLNKSHTILSRQLAIIDSVFNNYEICLVTGFQGDRVSKNAPAGINIVQNHDYENTNVLHSIGLGLNQVNTNRVVIIYGDLVFNKSALNVPFDLASSIVISNYMKDGEIGCILYKNKLEQMFYNLSQKWAQIIYLTNQELELMKQLANNPNNSMRFGFEAINQIVDGEGQFQAMSPKNAKAIDVDISNDIEIASKIR